MIIKDPYDIVRMHLESAADNGIVGPALDIKETIIIKHCTIRCAEPLHIIVELLALYLKQSFFTGRQNRARIGINNPRFNITMHPANSTAFLFPKCSEVVNCPTRY